MADLANYLLMEGSVWMPEGEAPICSGPTVGDITDTTGGEIEIGFDILAPKRRVYVRFRTKDLRELLDQIKGADNDD